MSATAMVSSAVAARRRLVPWVVVGGAVGVAAVGLILKATGARGVLGVPLPPFVMRWEPVIDTPFALLAAGALGFGVLIAPALIERVRSRVGFAVAVCALALALGLALGAARIGTWGWWRVFATGPRGSVEGRFEYLIALPVLRDGIGYYLHHFAALLPYTTTHVKGNPPGPLVALHLLGISTPGALAALCIAVGALSAPLAYDLGRVLGGERRGRIAGVLTAFSPAMLLFGVTSVDYAFTTLGLVVACLLVRGGRPGGEPGPVRGEPGPVRGEPRPARGGAGRAHGERGHPRALIAGSIAAALASFFSWLLLAIPAWAAVVTLRRHGPGRAAALCLSVALALVLWNGLLALFWGYDPFSALSATAGAYSHGIAAIRPYAFWVFGSPAAWIVMLGLPLAWFSLRRLRDDAAFALWMLVAFASVLGLTKAETERIWLPFVPLACVAAAGAVSALSPARLRLLLGALALQALVVELLFFTVW